MSTAKRKKTVVPPSLKRKVLGAVADTLEGMGVGEIMSLVAVEPADAVAVRTAFKALVHELRSRSK